MSHYNQKTIRVSDAVRDFVILEREKNNRVSENTIMNDLMEYAIKEKIRKRKKNKNGQEDNP